MTTPLVLDSSCICFPKLPTRLSNDSPHTYNGLPAQERLYTNATMRLKRVFFHFVLALFVLAVAFAPAATAYRDGVNLSAIVRENPANWTPRVPGTFSGDSKFYEVAVLAPLNGVMYAGGTFPQVKSADGATSYVRNNIFAFDANTGAVLPFAPIFDGPVSAILPSQDGKSLFVGGEFKTVNGQTVNRLVKLNATTGAIRPDFHVSMTGKVTDLDWVRDHLIVAGKFDAINGVTQRGLASLQRSTGTVTNYINVKMRGTVASTSSKGVSRFAVNAGQTQLAAAGNFTTVDGKSRVQMFILNLNANGDTLAHWDAPILHNPNCGGKTGGNAVVIEDLDFNKAGNKLFIADGGGPNPGICDGSAKFDTSLTGTSVSPDWVNKTGGDTLRSVEWTSAGVYVAGHQHHLSRNGSFVSRPGIGAIDPTSGQALSWNPGKGREIGSKELIVTNAATQPGFPSGLWVGSDSGKCGINVGEVRSHEGICFFPSS
jgi:hypothetical protein